VEPHLARYLPAGTVGHVTRLRMTGAHRMETGALLPRVAGAAAALADAGCDPVIFQCTANAMRAGLAAEREIVAAIAQATGGRAATTASATLAALAALGARRIVLVSPYAQPTHDHELRFMAEAGIEVVADRALDIRPLDSAPPAFWVDAVIALRHPQADAYFASCANIHAIDATERLEAALDRPVLTSNQVAIWHALRLAGIDDPVPGLGRLFAVRAAADAV
jgi:maleate isomerase